MREARHEAHAAALAIEAVRILGVGLEVQGTDRPKAVAQPASYHQEDGPTPSTQVHCRPEDSRRRYHEIRFRQSASERVKQPFVISGMNYSHSLIGYMLAGSLCLLSLAACADSATKNTSAAIRPDEARVAGSDGENRVASPAETVSISSSESVKREAHRDVATPATSLPRRGLVTSSKPLLVLGRVVPGKLSRRDGCIVVEIEGRTFTAVFPPAAKLVASGNSGEAVSWPGRTIPIGEVTRIPGGGSVTRSDLAAAPPATCPQSLYAIGG
ncbi:MAG: hypothetical protein WBR13_06640 [Allosphingosinicella sp.]